MYVANMNRRDFLQFMGLSGTAAVLPPGLVQRLADEKATEPGEQSAVLQYDVDELMEVHSVSMHHQIYDIGSDESFERYLVRANSGRLTLTGQRKKAF